MDYIGPMAQRGLLNVLATADTIHVCDGPVSSTDSLKSASLGTAYPRFLSEGSSLFVLPVTEGKTKVSGTATHWALTLQGEVLASAPLQSAKSVTSGLAFTLTRIEIGF